MSRSTAISRERPRLSNDRGANDRSELLPEISALKAEKVELVAAHAAEKDELVAKHSAEKAEFVAKHAAENAAATEENRKLRELTVALKQRIGELERSSNLFSGNSGKPPSSDGFAKPPPDEKKRKRVYSLRGKSKRGSGGQPGHPGATLRQVENPDHVIDLVPTACHRCRKEFPEGAESEGYVARQVHDVPEPKLEATECRAHSLRCDCEAVTEETFPEGVNAHVQYGPRLTGTAACPHAYQHLPLRRNAQAIKDMFGIAISEATVATMVERVARRCRRAVMLVGFHLARFAYVKNLDETGFPVAGRTMWVHVLCNALQTIFRLDEKRSAMFEGLTGILVHDRWGSYFLIPDVVHALRDPRIMRNLLAVETEDGEPWARKMRRLLLQVCLATWLARKKGKKELPSPFLAMIERVYVRILEEARFHHKGLVPFGPARDGKPGRKKRRPGLNLAEDMLKRKDEFLRFAHDLSVPSATTRPSRTSGCASCSRRSPAASGP